MLRKKQRNYALIILYGNKAQKHDNKNQCRKFEECLFPSYFTFPFRAVCDIAECPVCVPQMHWYHTIV